MMIPRAVWLPLFAALLVSCGGEHFEYRPGEIADPQGPGLFSGETGGFVFSSDKNSAADGGTDAKAKADPSNELSQERLEFEEFERWKRSNENPGEYQEFQEWREWKEYKKWKEAQPKALPQSPDTK